MSITFISFRRSCLLKKVHFITSLSLLYIFAVDANHNNEGMSMSKSRVRDLAAPMHLDLKAGPLCPMSNQGSPEALLKLQMAPRLVL